MSFLPDIDENGNVIDERVQPQLYTPPRTYHLLKEEERLAELNNLGHKKVTKDFSDSPHLNI